VFLLLGIANLQGAACMACLCCQSYSRTVLGSLVRLCVTSGSGHVTSCEMRSWGTVKTGRHGEDKLRVHREIPNRDEIEPSTLSRLRDGISSKYLSGVPGLDRCLDLQRVQAKVA
jgi:hypothetical protein